MPQEELTALLTQLNDSQPHAKPISMDSSIEPTRHAGIFNVTTTDFFYPLVEDPYIQGKIACANVLSDLYATGVVECDTMLMILAGSTDMTPSDRHIVTREMIRGFSDLATEAGTRVTGGQTVLNPWPIIGGVAQSICAEGEFIRPDNLQVGDVLVLTKPLGTQLAVNAYQWMHTDTGGRRWQATKRLISEDEVTRAFELASVHMARLNRNGALMMHKHGSHGGTDVTGFGILGHAKNLAEHQTGEVDIELDTLPIIQSMRAVDEALGSEFKLSAGFSAETSGGLLVAVPADNADAFIRDITELDGHPAWVVGKVVPRKGGANTARISEECTFLDI